MHVQAWHRFYWPTWIYFSRPPTGDTYIHVLTKVSRFMPQVSYHVFARLATLVNGLSDLELLGGQP